MSARHKDPVGPPGTLLRCKGPGCKNTVKYRSRKWTNEWMMTWVESKGKLFDVCSMECADALKEKHAKHAAAVARRDFREADKFDTEVLLPKGSEPPLQVFFRDIKQKKAKEKA